MQPSPHPPTTARPLPRARSNFVPVHSCALHLSCLRQPVRDRITSSETWPSCGAFLLVNYDIENIKKDHPVLLTGNFEACATARCRSGASSPWPLTIECQQLPRLGTNTKTCELAWQPASEASADKVEKTYQAKRLTEDAAIGVCAAVFAALQEGEIDEVTAHGTGVDYWVDNRRAVLEISGLKGGDRAALTQRHRDKTRQLRNGSLFKAGHPGYVFVVAFGQKEAIFSYHT